MPAVAFGVAANHAGMDNETTRSREEGEEEENEDEEEEEEEVTSAIHGSSRNWKQNLRRPDGLVSEGGHPR